MSLVVLTVMVMAMVMLSETKGGTKTAHDKRKVLQSHRRTEADLSCLAQRRHCGFHAVTLVALGLLCNACSFLRVNQNCNATG